MDGKFFHVEFVECCDKYGITKEQYDDTNE